MAEKTKKLRLLTTRDVLMTKHNTYKFTGVWLDALGVMQQKGIVLIWGLSKQGKTWFTLLMCKMLQEYDKILYVCAEQKLDYDFNQSMIRSGITYEDNRIQWKGYLSFEEIDKILKRRNAPRVCVIDNLTMYSEVKKSELSKFINSHPTVLFILISHEDRKKPEGALAKLAEKLAMRIIYIDMLVAFIGGRKEGKTFIIDEHKAALCHGHEIVNN